MRILFVGALGATSTTKHRLQAMQRLGHDIVGFDTEPYLDVGNGLTRRLRMHLLMGGAIQRLNRDLLGRALSSQSDVVWVDKGLAIRRQTIAAMRAAGIYTAHQNQDNPFGPRKNPNWRVFLDALPEYDLHLVPRERNLTEYRAAGAREVAMLYCAYEPSVLFPPPPTWSDKDRSIDVLFIGFPYDRRPAFLSELWQRYGIRTSIWGDHRWKKRLSEDVLRELWQGESLWNDAYRQKIWQARICLSFITHENYDEVAHRSFEITACRSFMLAEDSPAHRAHFDDGSEAAFFDSVEDCANKIRRYLPDEATRAEIAAAGERRSRLSGYSNDGRLEPVLRYIAAQIEGRRR